MGLTSLEPALQSRGRYDVGKVLAVGGMATIHHAFDRLTGREVAYKVLRVDREANRPRMAALFRREFDTLVRLAHPNIVAAYEFGTDERGPYYVMELVSGEDLARTGRLPVPEACRVVRDVASALALVHARRLIHRDVSPNNVRLTRDNDARLIDFGALTSFGVPSEVVGTPAFMAPECLTGEALDQRVDLYALGALAYWALTGQLAVRAYALDELSAAWEVPIPAPSTLVPEVSAELDDLVLSLLCLDRTARPTTAGEVVERLTSLAGLAPEHDEPRVAASYVKHPPLRARDAAIGEFALSLEALRNGRGGVLLIEGGPGSGLTAALERLGIDAQLSGATVLRVDGALHEDAPLGAVLHLVRTGAAIYPDLGEQLRERTSSLLLPQPRVASPTEVVERATHLASRLQDVLLQLGLRGPTVLLVDDAHLLDRQSLALLASMALELPRHSMLLALSRRNEPARNDAEVVLATSAKRVVLTPLSENDVIDLVQTMFGGVPNSLRLGRWLFAESAGNPAHCLDLVGWLLRRGAVRYTRGTFTLPHDVEPLAGHESGQALLVDRITRLGATSARIARLLALHGSALDLTQLTDASGRTTKEVLEDIQALAGQSLIIESAGSYALASRALCAILVSELDEVEKRELHLVLARVLDSRSGASLRDKMAAGLYRIRAGGEDELAGAMRIAALARQYDHDEGFWSHVRDPLVAALTTLEKHGYSDRECISLIGLLSALGFYGDLAAQRRYVDRMLRAYAQLTGIGLAARLARFIGQGLALVVGLLFGALFSKLHRSRLPKVSFREHLQNLMGLVTACVAAEACALNTSEAQRIAHSLDALAPAPPGSALQIGRQNALAIAEASILKYDRAAERFTSILSSLEHPVPGLDDRLREQLRHGCINCLAMIYGEDEPERALEAADALARTTFFAPHAELIRMFHHGLRGDQTRAEQHRTRAETLALLGGVSWSAVVYINLRCYGVSLRTSNVVELARTTAELERLSGLSPTLAAQHRLAQADLLLLRGRASEAVPIYAEVLATDVGRQLPTYRYASSFYARALLESGEPEQAKALCERVLAARDEAVSLPLAGNRPFVEQQLALAEATLGNVSRGAALLEAQLSHFAATATPLLLGELHRDRARVALLARDEDAFDRHFREMQLHFGATGNPWLVQQCDALLTRAVRAGMLPAIPARELSAITDSSTDMDGSTAIEVLQKQG